jgi:hypothetical protein
MHPLSSTIAMDPLAAALAIPPPFDDPRADVVLRSSDGVDLRMHKIDLCRASPVFETMFSLPQPASTEPAEDDAALESKKRLPVVPLTECAGILIVLFGFCTLGQPPALDSLDVVVCTLEAARKYDVAWAFGAACEALGRRAEEVNEAIRVYAVACLYGLEQQARKAALFCLRTPFQAILDADSKELDTLSAHGFRRLLKYRQACQRAAVRSAKDYRWVKQLSDRPWERSCCGSTVKYGGTKVQKWWNEYMETTLQELESRTWQGIVIKDDILTIFSKHKPCAECCAQISGSWGAFVAELSKRISEAVSGVKKPILRLLAYADYILLSGFS